MPIGSTLTNSVPAVGSSGTAYATSVNALLNEMKTAIEGTVPFSALSGSTLDMNNVPIIDASYVAFYNTTGTPSAAIAGRFVYSDGELWAVNSTGAIQITSGSGLNASAIGGIGGDYGSPNPASVQFVDAAWRYDFYDNYTALEYGYVRSAGVDIASGGHVATSNFAKLRYAGSTNLTFTFPDSVAAGGLKSLIQIDDAGNLKVNNATNQVTDVAYFANNISMAAGTAILHGSKYIQFVPQRGVCYVTAGALNTSTNVIAASGGSTTVKVSLPPMELGQRIKDIKLKGYKSTAGSLSFYLHTVTLGASAVETESAIGATATTTTSGVYTVNQTYTETVSSLNNYRLSITLPANTDSCWIIEITYDRV